MSREKDLAKKVVLKIKRKKRVGGNIFGTAEKPRVSIFKSNRYVNARAINDVEGVTLAAVSSKTMGLNVNKENTKKVAAQLAENLRAADTESVVYDRNGYLYHGVVAAFADGLRANGTKLQGLMMAVNRKDFQEVIVKTGRVTKVVKGGGRFRPTALVTVGDKNGTVGFGTGKAKEILDAIKKALDDAFKSLVTVSVKGTTIVHDIEHKYDVSKILLRPAPEGTGLIAGGAARPVLELSGVKDIIAKSLGSDNPSNLVQATVKALAKIKG